MSYQLNVPQAGQCLISDKEAAKLLGCSSRHIFSLRKRGELPFTRIGSLIRYRLSDLEAYITRQTVNAGGAHVE